MTKESRGISKHAFKLFVSFPRVPESEHRYPTWTKPLFYFRSRPVRTWVFFEKGDSVFRGVHHVVQKRAEAEFHWKVINLMGLEDCSLRLTTIVDLEDHCHLPGPSLWADESFVSLLQANTDEWFGLGFEPLGVFEHFRNSLSSKKKNFEPIFKNQSGYRNRLASSFILCSHEQSKNDHASRVVRRGSLHLIISNNVFWW